MRVLIGVLAVAGVALLITGCASDFDRCSGYGYSPGSDGFAACMQSVDISRRNAMAGAGAALMAPPPQPTYAPISPPMPSVRPMNTVCQPLVPNTYCTTRPY